MSGVLKVIGSVASIAAMIPGPHQPFAVGIAVAANVGAALTAKRPGQGYSGSVQDLKIDTGAGIPYIMGRCYSGGNVVHRATYGSDNQYYGWVVVYSGGGPVQEFEQFYVDRAPVNFSGSNAIGTFHDYLYLQTQLGATPEATNLSMNSMPNWGAGYKLSGYAALAPRFGFDKDGKKFAGGLPAFGAVFKGAKVYDPRLDSTYPGGSGSHRALDEDTYEYSQNPWLHDLTFALGRWQNPAEWGGVGRRVLGCGMPFDLIDVASFVEAANVADANGWTIGGLVYSTDDKWNTLKLIAQAGGGEIVSTGGKLTAMVNAPKVSLATITGDDLSDGALSVPATQSRRDRINGVIPRYRSEAHFWEIVPQDVIRIDDYVTEDGGERTREFEYPLVANIDQAAELAAYDIFNARELGPIVLPLKPKWLGYRIGDCLTIDIPELGLNEQDAIVIGRSLDAGTGAITLTFKSETAAKHAAALGQTGVAPPSPTLTYVDPSVVAAPNPTHWSLAGATFTDNGVSIPALVVERVPAMLINPNAEAIIVEFRPYDAGNGPDDNWAGLSVEPYTMVRKEIGTVTPGTDYEVSLRYQVRGVVGDRLVMGPETAGDFSVPGTGAGSMVAEDFIAQEFPALSGDIQFNWRNPRNPAFSYAQTHINGVQVGPDYIAALGSVMLETDSGPRPPGTYHCTIVCYTDGGTPYSTDDYDVEIF